MADPNANYQATNDDSFVAFSFAIVSMLMLVLYTPFLWGVTTALSAKLSGKKKTTRDDEPNSLDELKAKIATIPRVALTFLTNPGAFVAGARLLVAQRDLTLSLYLPRFLRFILRPKILVLWLWVLLLSMVMYTSFTFDAHGVLGVKQDASLSDVKKAYRRLSKQYHPDQNSTETARVLYHQVRKAYKALVNKEEFEEEARKEDYSVGVALPSFLTSKDNEYFVLFGMLTLMLGIPLTLFFRFRDGERKLPSLIEKLKKEQVHVPAFLHGLGVPKDRKYEEKKLSRSSILSSIMAAGLAPSNANEASINGFPLFPTFIAKLQNPSPHIGYLKGLGFDDAAIEVMSKFTVGNGAKLVADYEAKLDAICGPASAAESATVTASNAEYVAARYLMRIHTARVADTLDEVTKLLPAEVRAVRRIIGTHEEMYDLMVAVFEKEKPTARQIQSLADVPRQLEDAYEELIPDIEKLMRKTYRQHYEEQVGKKQLKQMQRAANRNGGPGPVPDGFM